MIGELINHLWQSTLFAMVAGLLAFMLRRNRAQVRYWIWFGASVKFLVPFALLIGLASQMQWAPAAHEVATQIATPDVSLRVVQISQPFPDTLPVALSTRGSRDWISLAVFGVWACGFAGIALIRFRDWLRIRAAVCASSPTQIAAAVEVRSSPGLLEPGVAGLWRPILLLPAGIEERLTPAQLEAVLAHELCHVRRRDNLISAIHMAVEALFWFLPRVWLIGAKLVEERERACDEEVLSRGSDPHVYAEAILNVCKLYVESPLACVSGVTGTDIKKRIEAIMSNRAVLKLNFGKKLALMVVGMVALAAPIVVGILNTPAIRAQSPPSKAAARPKFEVASIRPCGSGDSDGPGGGKKGGGGGGGAPSPGRLTIGCMALVDSDGLIGLIHRAYDRYADGKINQWAMTPISGGPAWIRTERYDINAKAEGNASDGTMNGPMLQVLLEERFKLKVHRETRQMPVYALTVAKGGPKIQPFKEGSCAPPDFTKDPPVAPGQRPCMGGIGGRRGPNITSDAQRTSLDEFAKLLGLVLDRPVINKTGLAGLYDFHLAFGIDQATPRYLPGGDAADFPAQPSNEGPAPTIFTAIQEQLGLRLEATKGPREYIVIDHVEKPSPN